MARLSVSGRYAVAAVMAPSRRRAFPSLPSFSSLLSICSLQWHVRFLLPLQSNSTSFARSVGGRGSGRTAVWRTIAEPGRGRSSAPPPSNARTRGRALQGCLSVYPMTTKPTQPSTRTEFCPHSSFRAKAEGGAGAGAVEGGREASARWG